jgi:hypothetical protein
MLGFGFVQGCAAGVDILSHQKKAAFWRELVELFPNMIDYMCNPNIDAVRSAPVGGFLFAIRLRSTICWRFLVPAGPFTRRSRRVR